LSGQFTDWFQDHQARAGERDKQTATAWPVHGMRETVVDRRAHSVESLDLLIKHDRTRNYSKTMVMAGTKKPAGR
jgi:hypothetical protein